MSTARAVSVVHGMQGQEARLVFISTTLTRLPRTDAGQYTAAQENLAVAGSWCFVPVANAVAGDNSASVGSALCTADTGLELCICCCLIKFDMCSLCIMACSTYHHMHRQSSSAGRHVGQPAEVQCRNHTCQGAAGCSRPPCRPDGGAISMLCRCFASPDSVDYCNGSRMYEGPLVLLRLCSVSGGRWTHCRWPICMWA